EQIKGLKERSSPPSQLKSPKPAQGKKIHKHFVREQTHIVIGTNAFPMGRDEDLYLKMLTAYLSGQSSELFVEVRDRLGLCYAVQPVHTSMLEAGSWGIYIGAGHDKKDLAI